MIGIEGSGGPTFRVSLHFYWKPSMCGPNEAVVCQQLGVLGSGAKSGRIILNVTGQMEAQVAAGQGHRRWRTRPCCGEVCAGLGRISAQEKPSTWSPGRGREGHLSGREAPAAAGRGGSEHVLGAGADEPVWTRQGQAWR